jgi:hypothetical protein
MDCLGNGIIAGIVKTLLSSCQQKHMNGKDYGLTFDLYCTVVKIVILVMIHFMLAITIVRYAFRISVVVSNFPDITSMNLINLKQTHKCPVL